jgi:hypothetical protein
MLFWRSVAKGNHPKARSLSFMLPVAAMLLAHPAGESIDEFAFSTSGRILSKERNRLAPQTVEKLTVIRMFINNFGMSYEDLDTWVLQTMADMDAAK